MKALHERHQNAGCGVQEVTAWLALQRQTSGVSYVCASSLNLPHLVMRPLSSPSEPSGRAVKYCKILQQEVRDSTPGM